MTKSTYMVTCDAEVMFTGTKQKCRAYFDKLPNPMPMTLHRITQEWSLVRYRRENK